MPMTPMDVEICVWSENFDNETKRIYLPVAIVCDEASAVRTDDRDWLRLYETFNIPGVQQFNFPARHMNCTVHSGDTSETNMWCERMRINAMWNVQ